MDNKERDALIAELLGEGLSLSDVQKALKDEHGVQLTYMELRMISLDLAVDWKKQDAAKEESTVEDKVIDPDALDDDDVPLGSTQVNVSKVVRPGSVMSGDVTFKSGARAEWFLDQMGRLGLNPIGDSDKPNEEDIQEFQMELQRQLQGPL